MSAHMFMSAVEDDPVIDAASPPPPAGDDYVDTGAASPPLLLPTTQPAVQLAAQPPTQRATQPAGEGEQWCGQAKQPFYSKTCHCRVGYYADNCCKQPPTKQDLMLLQPGQDGSIPLNNVHLDNDDAARVDDIDGCTSERLCRMLTEMLAAKLQHSASNESVTTSLGIWMRCEAVDSELRAAIKRHASTYDKALQFLQQRLMQKCNLQEVISGALTWGTDLGPQPWSSTTSPHTSIRLHFCSNSCCLYVCSLVPLHTTSAKMPTALSSTEETSRSSRLAHCVTRHAMPLLPLLHRPRHARRWCTCPSRASYSTCSAVQT
jgi:hypothetical protein